MSDLQSVFVDTSPESRTFVLRKKISPPRDGHCDVYEVYKFNQTNILVENLLKVLAKYKANFYEQLCIVDERTMKENSRRTQRYFAKSEGEISKEYAQAFEGYWLNKNTGPSGTKVLIREACEAASVKYRSLGTLRIGS